jgi:hypothetical protein
VTESGGCIRLLRWEETRDAFVWVNVIFVVHGLSQLSVNGNAAFSLVSADSSAWNELAVVYSITGSTICSLHRTVTCSLVFDVGICRVISDPVIRSRSVPLCWSRDVLIVTLVRAMIRMLTSILLLERMSIVGLSSMLIRPVSWTILPFIRMCPRVLVRLVMLYKWWDG